MRFGIKRWRRWLMEFVGCPDYHRIDRTSSVRLLHVFPRNVPLDDEVLNVSVDSKRVEAFILRRVSLRDAARSCSAAHVTFRLPTATWASFTRTPGSVRFQSRCSSPPPEKTFRRRSDAKRVFTRAEITLNGLRQMYRWNSESAVRCRQLLVSHTSPATLCDSGDKFVENGSNESCLVSLYIFTDAVPKHPSFSSYSDCS